jgi:TATA-box binding protein (TBP) (component of TFIID and TFIIIB)
VSQNYSGCKRTNGKERMNKFADNHTFNYLATLAEFRKSYHEDHRPSWVKITTITIISKFLQDIDIHKLRSKLETAGIIHIRAQGSTFEGFEWNLKPTTFYNQVTLGYTDQYSTKSIKVFPNGSIQVAGCSDLFDCRRIIKQLSFLLKNMLEVDIPSNGFRVVMINSNFSLNYNINLMETSRLFFENKLFTEVEFNPDNYSAVKIKFKPAEDMKQVTASIFSTGKIIVTGAETLKEIAFAYNVINQHINFHKNQIKVAKTVNTDVFDTVYGYNIDDCIKYVEEQGYEPWTFTRTNVPINF